MCNLFNLDSSASWLNFDAQIREEAVSRLILLCSGTDGGANASRERAQEIENLMTFLEDTYPVSNALENPNAYGGHFLVLDLLTKCSF